MKNDHLSGNQFGLKEIKSSKHQFQTIKDFRKGDIKFEKNSDAISESLKNQFDILY